MAEVTPEDMKRREISQAFPNSPYFLISPLLKDFVKITGSNGDVDPNWRKDKRPNITKITRLLDAFQHFVYAKSNHQLLITDLQGVFD